MTGKIELLDEQTINQIAAGEVIENPASVVKELVENALDAGATAITIEIRSGGRQLIRVSDNGSGMGSADAVRSLERHATSKIRAIGDIHAIHTMGFRGEAIPSIASISKLSILTCSQEEEMGTLVEVEGGKQVQSAPAQRDPGTTVEVDALFYNVPVRKKFQRSPAYDANEVHKAVSSLSLAHPSIKFTLVSEGKALLKTSLPQGESFQKNLEIRIREVLGKEFALGLCPLSLEKGGIKLEGSIGLPHCNRHNRTGQYLFINGRAVFSPLVSFAVKEGYGTAMGTHRHPIFVLHLTIPGDQVDVNVHPQKREVRLRYSQQVKEVVIKAVEQALSLSTVPHETLPLQAPPYSTTASIFDASLPFVYSPPKPPAHFPKDWMLRETETVEEKVEATPLPAPQPLATLPKVLITAPGFILVQKEEGALYWIHQHNAHARVLFDRANKAYLPETPIQQLLIPLHFDFSPTEAAAIKLHLETLDKWGLGIREFGPHSFTIDALPPLWEEAGIQELLHAIAHEEGSHSEPIKKMLVKRASRSAFPLYKKLSCEEAQILVNQLIKCDQPAFCPLGKPTMVKISFEEIAKLFET